MQDMEREKKTFQSKRNQKKASSILLLFKTFLIDFPFFVNPTLDVLSNGTH